MRDCGPVDLVELHRPTLTAAVDIPVQPNQLFEILEDAEAWPRWLTAITKVVWTSADPKGLGTTRTVEIGRGFVANEEFICWETNRRMAFRFTDCSRPVFRVFAEDYRIESIDQGCRLTWSVLVRPRGIPESLVKVTRPLLAMALRHNLDRLRTYAVTRYHQV
ncbi:SRPBCC family protein [Mycolicibacterium vinylchloridicum]|uniref:SRPBCC family protein n=1 Tax=Mycolicibacterium vinylchloridicum TaxID=2736928 RepID=UPI003898DAD0